MPAGRVPDTPISMDGGAAPNDHGNVAAESTASHSDRATTDAGTQPADIVVSAIGRRDPKTPGWLIHDASFTVTPGARFAVRGATGSGKTVLLRALALLDPLDAGSIQWRGNAVCGAAVPHYRTQVIYIHQRPAIFEGTVEENLRRPYALQAHRGKAFDRGRVIEYLDRLGRSATFLAKSSRDLSGGEAQIVALLRAIQLDPSVLLLDEPTASLDQATAQSIEALVDGWFRAGQGARAFIWVSHDPEQLARVADRFLSMTSGRLRRRPEMSTPYLELSYVQVGLAALLILINGALSVLLEARPRAPAFARRGFAP